MGRVGEAENVGTSQFPHSFSYLTDAVSKFFQVVTVAWQTSFANLIGVPGVLTCIALYKPLGTKKQQVGPTSRSFHSPNNHLINHCQLPFSSGGSCPYPCHSSSWVGCTASAWAGSSPASRCSTPQPMRRRSHCSDSPSAGSRR